MRAGELNQRVTIEVVSITQDDIGQTTHAWSTLLTIWAQVQTAGGSEKFYGGELVAEATHKVKMRFISGLNSRTIRLRWRSRILDVVFIDESRQSYGELFMLAKELPD